MLSFFGLESGEFQPYYFSAIRRIEEAGVKTLRFRIVAATILIMASSSLVADVKIGIVDSQRILSTFAAAVDANKQLETENNQWAQELQKLTDELRRQEEELDRRSLLLSEAKREESMQELKSLEDQIQKFRENTWGESGKYFQRQQELMRPVFTRINEVINMLGEEEKYDIILDTVQGNVLYAKQNFDITQDVLDELESDLPETSDQTSQR
jgi:outer membrane protein